MTYTFKLSRRLAMSRYAALALVALVAACSAGDVGGPIDDSAGDLPGVDAATVSVTPDTLTLETNQLARFSGQVRSSLGDSVGVSIEWSASGGTITTDGVFTSATAGTFKIVGRGRQKADTATVVVVAPPPPSPPPSLPPPAPSVPSAGVAFGVWHLPSSSYASTPYTGAYLGYGTVVSASTPAGFLAQIAQAKAANRRLMINLVSRKSAAGGGPDMAHYLAGLEQFRPYAAQLQAYADDGTIVGIMMADEPNCGSCWGNKVWTIAQLQQVAEAVRALLPGIARGFRVDPAWLKGFNAPALYAAIDFAWTQYEGPLHLPCAKAIATCIATASTNATSIGLKLVMGMNTLDGGDGSSGIPGTFDLATVKTRWQLSGAEVLKYGLPLVTDPRVCAVLSWRYGANATKAQINSQMTDQQLADILSFDARMQTQLDSVAKVAAAQPARSCKKA